MPFRHMAAREQDGSPCVSWKKDEEECSAASLPAACLSRRPDPPGPPSDLTMDADLTKLSATERTELMDKVKTQVMVANFQELLSVS